MLVGPRFQYLASAGATTTAAALSCAEVAGDLVVLGVGRGCLVHGAASGNFDEEHHERATGSKSYAIWHLYG